IDGAEDAWRVACAAVARGEDVDAEGLGRAVAGVHLALARELPTVSVDDAGRAAVVGAWRQRARLANAAVPALAQYRERVARVYEAAEHAAWPELQRIHGDLHLGQVMLARRGWILLDFEGEPLRPLAERRRPDLPLRDVAGMLRSFDYAAGANPGERELAWTERQRESFLDGYAKVAPDPRGNGDLLRALELDKALYEARYEAGNRPDWLGIPLRGIARLTAHEGL
nr:phosphotransferase [Actinomycetales bacterium]